MTDKTQSTTNPAAIADAALDSVTGGKTSEAKNTKTLPRGGLQSDGELVQAAMAPARKFWDALPPD